MAEQIGTQDLLEDEDDEDEFTGLDEAVDQMQTSTDVTSAVGQVLRERSKYIPLRLTYDERKLLRLYESCYSISC
jgi:hypothetical protein